MPPMPPKAGPKAGGKKGPPAAMLAKIKAQMEAQKKAEEEAKRQEEEERRAWEEAEKQRLLDERLHDEEKKEKKEDDKVALKAAKETEKERLRKEHLARMQAAGLIVPDIPAKKEDGEVKKAPPKPAPKKKPAPKHVDPAPTTVAAWDEVQPDSEPEDAAPLPEPDPDEDDWEAMLAKEEAAEKAAAAAAAKAAEKAAKAESKAKPAEAAPAASPASSFPEAAPAAPQALMSLRSPICCVLGHVDTGKTSLLDRIRLTNVQGGEAGGITQQIGATFFPRENIVAATDALREKHQFEMKVPGLLVIDTPGHESFTNLRSRGSNLCDIAVLVVDLMHGIEPQTRESIKLLKARHCPFIVALNKVDRLYDWKPNKNMDIEKTLALQAKHVHQEYHARVQDVITQFAEEGLNAELYYKNKDVKKYVSLVPTSAHSGEGIADLLLLKVQLVQRFLENKVAYKDDLQCTVLEVKIIEGLGTTIDVVLVNGTLKEGQQIVICGLNGAIVTTIRALLTPQPLKELRVKGAYVHHKEIRAAQGIKISAPELEDAVPGAPLFVVNPGDNVEALKKEVMKDLATMLEKADRSGVGVCVQSSTLGALEALLSFLKDSKIPVSTIAIGPIHKRHVMSALAHKDRHPKFAVILAFDVPVSKEAEEIAKKNNIRIFTAKIIYHLFDMFTNYVKRYDEEVAERNRELAVFPAVVTVGEQLRNKNPMIFGASVAAGQLHVGTPLCVVKDKEIIPVGKVIGMEREKKDVKVAKQGQADFAVKMVHPDPNFCYGKVFEQRSELFSMISRDSIDALKESFKKDMTDDDWRLIIKLKKQQRVQ